MLSLRGGRNLTVSELGVRLGVQRPRVASVPPFESCDAGRDAVELARMAGLELDPWQAFVLEQALAERGGRWASFEVGLTVARQNGKGSILEARELAGLFLFGERLIIHSAHLFDTSLEAFNRILERIQDTPDLDRQLKRVSRSHGEEGIELKSGQRLRFKTRTAGGGRGFTADTVILDEAYNLPESAVSALLPTMSARPNPQLWYTSSAVNAEQHPNGWVLARVRDRGLSGGDPSLTYLEWSVDPARYDAAPHEVACDPEAWLEANPGAGRRISLEHIGREQRSMQPKAFAVERLSVGDWPVEVEQQRVIPSDVWAAGADERSAAQDPVAFAVDVAQDRSSASVGMAGLRGDGLFHVEPVDVRRGVGWVVDRVAELNRKWSPIAVVVDGRGAAANLVPSLEQVGVSVTVTSAGDMAKACGGFFDAVVEGRLRHINDRDLNDAVAMAAKRSLGDAWAWDRKTPLTDISPLVAVTLALHGFNLYAAKPDTGGWMVSL